MVQIECLRQEGATVFSKMQDLCACVVRLIFYIRQPLSKQACLKIAASPAQHGTINEERFVAKLAFISVSLHTFLEQNMTQVLVINGEVIVFPTYALFS